MPSLSGFPHGRDMRAKKIFIGLTALLTTALQAPVQAANFLWDDWSSWPYGFSAAYSSQQIDADVAGQKSQFDVLHAGLELIELNNTWLQAGMFGGKVWGDQSDFAPATGIDLSGFYGGITLRRMLFDGNWFKLGLEGRYTYQNLKDNDIPKRIEVKWHQSDVTLGTQVNLGRYIALYGGASGMYLDGSERVGVAPSSDLGGAWSQVNFLGLDLLIEAGGHVGFEAKQGSVDGFEIYFQHRY